LSTQLFQQILIHAPLLGILVRQHGRIVLLVMAALLIQCASLGAYAQTSPPATAPTVEAPGAAEVPVLQPAPAATPSPRLDSGNTAWMLTSTALVLLMTLPGVALFYGGMVRKKNVLSTMTQSVAIAAVVTLTWTIIGYSLALRPGGDYLGGLDRILLAGMPLGSLAGNLGENIPESVFIMFQLTFAIITAALVPGAFAERMKFSAVLWFTVLWSVFVYAPIAHWVWEPTGWLAKMGALDYAGGTVVHVNAGVAGLVCALVLGHRRGFGEEPMSPHNLTLTITGAALLWVGWFGFNAGSALGADARAGMAMLVTQIATATAALVWMIAEWLIRGRPSALGLVSGAVGGLVAITPASGFVDPTGALIIGLAAGVGCYLGATALKRIFGYDDSLDVFGIHGIGGAIGALLTGVLALPEIGGAKGHVDVQAIGIVATACYSGIATWIILKVVDILVGLRVAPETETEGLDLTEHGEAA
jgi:Amt family ammonium transporter